MNLEENHKLAIIIDSSLPMGLIANTASVLSLSIGKFIDGIIGEDLTDKRQKKTHWNYYNPHTYIKKRQTNYKKYP